MSILQYNYISQFGYYLVTERTLLSQINLICDTVSSEPLCCKVTFKEIVLKFISLIES
jgi:hypothetical protein